MRRISIESSFTHSLVDDAHAAQGSSVVAEVILDGRVGHLAREKERKNHRETFYPKFKLIYPEFKR